METQTVETLKNCPKCEAEIPADSRFCVVCGVNQNIIDETIAETRWPLAKQAGLFFLINLITCVVFSNSDKIDGIFWLLLADSFLAIVSLIFFVYNWDQTKSGLKWPSFSLPRLLLYCLIAIVASVMVSFITNWLNVTFFSKESHYYTFFARYTYGPYLMILCVAVTPAIFEELGFRGYLLQALDRVLGPKQAIYVSSFMFAIMHLSFLSLFWLLPFALFLGYLRIKENTLWYGVAVHFCFNLTACLIELYLLA